MWYITCPVCTVLLVNLLCQLCVVKRAIMSDTSIGLHSQSIQPVDCMYHVWGPWGGFCPVPCVRTMCPALCHVWEPWGGPCSMPRMGAVCPGEAVGGSDGGSRQHLNGKAMVLGRHVC